MFQFDTISSTPIFVCGPMTQCLRWDHLSLAEAYLVTLEPRKFLITVLARSVSGEALVLAPKVLL